MGRKIFSGGRKISMKSTIRTYILETRPWSFTMTIISVTLGAVTAAYSGRFDWLMYILVLVGMLCAHAASNVINDYFDVKNKVDLPESPTARYREHYLLKGMLTPGKVLTFSIILYAVAGAIAVYLIIFRGLPILYIAAVGAFLSFFYTGGPVKYKYRALGEIAVFFAWGPLMLLGTYYAVTGSWEGFQVPLWISIPQGLWVTLVILANNMKDIEFDGSVGVKTTGTLLSRKRAVALFGIILFVIYGVIALESALRIIPFFSLVTFASLPMSFRLLSILKKSKEIPPDADPRTVQLGMIFGLLFIISLLLPVVFG